MTDGKEAPTAVVDEANDAVKTEEASADMKPERNCEVAKPTTDSDDQAEVTEDQKESVNSENGDASGCTGEKESTETNPSSDDPNAWRPIEEEKSTLPKSTSGNEDGEAEKPANVESEETTEKKRTYNRKVVRLPKEVFDFMARIEEDGVVRFNLTQLGVFYLNELKFMGSNVDALHWDEAEVPVLQVSVPPTAKGDPTLIVDHFSCDPEVREAQETRLKGILENREKLRKLYESGEKVTLADIADRRAAKRLRKRERREERKKLNETETSTGKNTNDEKGDNSKKKRSAENTDSSTTLEGGVAAKQPRLESNDAKTFPKKIGGPQSGSKNVSSRRRTLAPQRRGSNTSHFRSGPGAFFGGRSDGRDRFRPRVRPFHDAPIREIPPLFPPRNGPSKVSPWSRPPFQEDMHKLEQVMRRAAHDNSSSFEAARQVERLGLGPAMGAMLNSDMPMNSYNDVAARQMPSLVDQAFTRHHEEPFGGPRYGEEPFGVGRYAGGRDAPIRDISGFVEPLNDFGDSPRKSGYPSSSHVERITYPKIGAGPAFAQSYSNFAEDSFRQRMDYGSGVRPRSVSPYGRTFYR
ncbi:hypothetical protein RB195_009678 [Necator americanus]|uniref:Uncharacterized protein n=1 Tax=Necator americanus TaxID=51031 RepID=A0ABR1CWU2_NECAM